SDFETQRKCSKRQRRRNDKLGVAGMRHNATSKRRKRRSRERGGRSIGSTLAKTPPERGFLEERMMGFEPTTFCMASRRSSQLSYIRAGAKYSLGYAASKASLTSLSASSLCSRRTEV